MLLKVLVLLRAHRLPHWLPGQQLHLQVRGNQRYNSAPDNMSTFIDWWFKPDVTEAGGRNFCTSSVKEKCLKWFDIGISQVISVF